MHIYKYKNIPKYMIYFGINLISALFKGAQPLRDNFL